jgi:alkylation response protein AidB-like acyl-CoA dehydrogenase
MQFAFTDDQLAITQAAREMLVDTCTPADLRKLLARGETFDKARWQTIQEMGLIGLLAPEARGGLGMTLTDFVGIAEAAGYVGLPEPLVELAGITVPLLAAMPNDHGLLARVFEGAVVGLGHPLNPFVAGADDAEAFLLGAGDSVYFVERGDAVLTPQAGFDPFRGLSKVAFAPSPGANTAISWGDTADRGALLAAAQMIGLAQRCVDLSVAYAKDRMQFGKPIGSYQAVKHMVASAQVKIEFARPVVHAAAAELPLGTLAARARVAHAKIAAGEAADLAARTAVQVHGAMGMTWEVDLHFFLKRAFALNQAWGTPAMHRATLIERMETLPVGPDRTFASEVAA